MTELNMYQSPSMRLGYLRAELKWPGRGKGKATFVFPYNKKTFTLLKVKDPA
jgi:hypothetical protein